MTCSSAPSPRRPTGAAPVVDRRVGTTSSRAGSRPAWARRPRPPGVRPRRHHRHGALRRHGDRCSGSCCSAASPWGPSASRAHASARLGAGSSRRRHLLPRPPAALRRAGQWPLGRLVAYAAFPFIGPRWPAPRASPTGVEPDGVGAAARGARWRCWGRSSPSRGVRPAVCRPCPGCVRWRSRSARVVDGDHTGRRVLGWRPRRSGVAVLLICALGRRHRLTAGRRRRSSAYRSRSPPRRLG